MKNQTTSPALIRAIIHMKMTGRCVGANEIFNGGQNGQGDENDHPAAQFILFVFTGSLCSIFISSVNPPVGRQAGWFYSWT